MRAVLQRVKWAKVSVGGEVVGAIDTGLVILLGVGQGDTDAEVGLLAKKAAGMRIFPDEAGKMNRSVMDAGGGALVVSQFTLYADCRKGRRPSFVAAEAPQRADALCAEFCAVLTELGIPVASGRFGAMMQVELCNDGPVTIILDSADLSRPRQQRAT